MNPRTEKAYKYYTGLGKLKNQLMTNLSIHIISNIPKTKKLKNLEHNQMKPTVKKKTLMQKLKL